MRSRRDSFPSIDSITNNSIDPERRAESGWVVSSVVSIRSALRSVSNLPTTCRSRSLNLTSKSLSPGHSEVVGPSGTTYGCCRTRIVKACQTSVFWRQERASALTSAYGAVPGPDHKGHAGRMWARRRASLGGSPRSRGWRTREAASPKWRLPELRCPSEVNERVLTVLSCRSVAVVIDAD